MEKETFIKLNGFNSGIFTIDGKTKEYPILKLAKLYNFLGDHLKTCADMMHELNYYNNYEDKIEAILDEREQDWELEDFKEPDDVLKYDCGGNFAKYMNTSRKIGKGIAVADNGQAGNILEADFRKLSPDNTLEFDTESSYCYVTTENREEARSFKLYVYNTHIKDTLKGWFEGWDEFVKDFKTASDDDKFNLTNLQY